MKNGKRKKPCKFDLHFTAVNNQEQTTDKATVKGGTVSER